MRQDPQTGWPGRRLALSAGVVLASIYLVASVYHLHEVNTDIKRTDQSAYLSYARKMHDTGYEYQGIRNRMPVFPFLASLLDEDGLPLESLFVRAKYMNIAISLVVLMGAWMLSRLRLRARDATALVLIAAFTIFVFKAPYAQTELLFYGLFFGSFCLLLRLLETPSVPVAMAAGVALGISYLTKASVVPLLAAYALWASFLLFEQRSSPGSSIRFAPALRSGASRGVAAIALVVICFLATVFPYIQNSKHTYGRWFYNMNSTFYMWTDSWAEVRASEDRFDWPFMSSAHTPGPARYLREHSLGQITERLVKGADRSLIRNLRHPFGYGKYLVLYSLLLIILIWRWPEEAGHVLLAKRRWIAAGFVISVISGYMLLYAFYSPIADGARLPLSLYLPTLFCLFLAVGDDVWRGRVLFEALGRRVRVAEVHRLAMVVLLGDILLLPWVIGKYAGH